MKYTHFGNLIWDDSRETENYNSLVILRQTKNFWVSYFGIKFSKKNYGYPIGYKCPMYRLDLDSVKEMEK